ncbi:MAG: CoA pyrophosphatase, partial [Anaerolineales bacterium]
NWGRIVKYISNINDETISRRLKSARDKEIDNPYPPDLLQSPARPAAVLIPLLNMDNLWHILYILRTKNKYDPHSGQVAFPGGAADEGDVDAIETALREAEEEIGIIPQDVKILGSLSPYYTITNYLVTPVVAHIPWPYELKLAPQEVSRAFTIPLEWLANSTNFDIKTRQIQGTYAPLNVIYYKPYDGEVLWGASARFTIGLLETLFGHISLSEIYTAKH